MRYEIRKIENDDELSHHGILGQRWGIRRYQYQDGSLTPEGRKHYGYTGVGSIRETFPTFTKWGVRAKEKKAKGKQDEHRRLIEYGSPKEIQKNWNKFSPSEFKEIQNRFATELSVIDQIEKLTNSSAKKDDKYSSITKGTKFIHENSENLSKSISSAKTFYNTVAIINNSLKKRADGTVGLRGPDEAHNRLADPGYMHLIR